MSNNLDELDPKDIKLSFDLFNKDKLQIIFSRSWKKDEFHEFLMEEMKYAPDDTGRVWKHPFLWAPQEIHELVLSEVGSDEIAARGYQILIKLWLPDDKDEYGMDITQQHKRDKMQGSRVGKVLRMGKECFTDKKRFPAGPRVTYGEWVVFKGSDISKSQIDGVMLASIYDDRCMWATTNPEKLITSSDIGKDYFDY